MAAMGKPHEDEQAGDARGIQGNGRESADEGAHPFPAAPDAPPHHACRREKSQRRDYQSYPLCGGPFLRHDHDGSSQGVGERPRSPGCADQGRRPLGRRPAGRKPASCTLALSRRRAGREHSGGTVRGAVAAILAYLFRQEAEERMRREHEQRHRNATRSTKSTHASSRISAVGAGSGPAANKETR